MKKNNFFTAVHTSMFENAYFFFNLFMPIIHTFAIEDTHSFLQTCTQLKMQS